MTQRNRSHSRLALGAGLALTLAAPAAFAQVESRCPTGWTAGQPIVPPEAGQRPLATCRRDPLTVGGLQIDAPITSGSQEQRLAVQLVMAAGFQPPEAMPTLRDETFGTVRARVHEVTADGEGPGGTTTRVSAAVALIRVNAGTVVLRAVSSSSRATALSGLRAYIPTLVGLDGTPPSWKVGLVGCPAPLTRMTADGVPPNGLRLAGVCAIEAQGRSVEVLESRLPIRNAAEARTSGEFFRMVMERAVTRAGGSVTLDEPTPITLAGVQGFYLAVHATAQTPQGALRIDRGIAVLPLVGGGHVEVLATLADSADPTAARTMLDALAPLLRLDGSQVTGAVTGTGTSDGDGGTPEDPDASASSERPRPRPAANTQTFDPNAPVWQPPPVERPRASTPTPQKNACGCAVPGAPVPRTPALLALAALALTTLRKRSRAHA
ncbi:MAG: MYXO-CTERM sorting domain-containing protein [Deltaproteobacteria bacterium]|nr:MYXO-CTERM sorting domain-containing protein [Deltaproteobacteria bacterium]